MATEPQSFKSAHQVLLRPPKTGLFLQAAALKTSSESQGELVLHRNQNYSPSPVLSWRPPSANRAGCLSARSSGQQGALHRAPPGAPSSKGSARYHVGPSDPVGQSPFSSNFCKLFCIFSNFIMFAVSSRQRTSTFNCTCDPRPDGAACSV